MAGANLVRASGATLAGNKSVDEQRLQVARGILESSLAGKPLSQHSAHLNVEVGIMLGRCPDREDQVMRIDRIDLASDADTTTCTVGQVWFWAAPGSGVWLNVGRSLVVRGDAARPGCREAHAQGYDTIQMPAAARPRGPRPARSSRSSSWRTTHCVGGPQAFRPSDVLDLDQHG